MAFVNAANPAYSFVMPADTKKLTILLTPEEHEAFDKDCRYGFETRVSMNSRIRKFVREAVGLPPLEDLALPKRKAKGK